MRRFPRSTPPIKLEVSKSAIRDFRRAAKLGFPNEVLAYLFGHDLGHTIIVESIWVPEDQEAATSWVRVHAHFDWEAAQLAVEEDLQVIGDIHSHPWSSKELKKLDGISTGQDRSPSETDWDCRIGTRWITGICQVDQTKTGKLRASERFWAPVQQLEIVVI